MGKKLQEMDISYLSHQSHYNMVRKEDFDVQILENVPEYSESVVKQHLKPETWGLVSAVLDPRLFGQKTSRPRRYFICWRRDRVEWISPYSMEDIINALRTCPVLDPLSYFWMKLPLIILSESQEWYVLSWERCCLPLLNGFVWENKMIPKTFPWRRETVQTMTNRGGFWTFSNWWEMVGPALKTKMGLYKPWPPILGVSIHRTVPAKGDLETKSWKSVFWHSFVAFPTLQFKISGGEFRVTRSMTKPNFSSHSRW